VSRKKLVIPAKPGIPFPEMAEGRMEGRGWMPVFTGMTLL
jgi:hypothetical protein